MFLLQIILFILQSYARIEYFYKLTAVFIKCLLRKFLELQQLLCYLRLRVISIPITPNTLSTVT